MSFGTFSSLLVSCFFGWAGFATAQMVPANDRVRVEVKVETAVDTRNLPNTTANKVTQRKTLTIQLSGKRREGESRVVRWTVLGRNVKTNTVHPLDSGEFKLALNAQGAQSVESKAITTTYTPEHSVVVNENRRKNFGIRANNRDTVPKTKRVAAEGDKYVGYTVQVLDGGKLVGQASDPVGLDVAPAKR